MPTWVCLLCCALLGLVVTVPTSARAGVVVPEEQDRGAWERAWREVQGVSGADAGALDVSVEASEAGWLVVVVGSDGVARRAPIPNPQSHEERVDALFLAVALADRRDDRGLGWPGMSVAEPAPEPEPEPRLRVVPEVVDLRTRAVSLALSYPPLPPRAPPPLGIVWPGGPARQIPDREDRAPTGWVATSVLPPLPPSPGTMAVLEVDQGGRGVGWVELGPMAVVRSRAAVVGGGVGWVGVRAGPCRLGAGVGAHLPSALALAGSGGGPSFTAVDPQVVAWLRLVRPVELGVSGGAASLRFFDDGPVSTVWTPRGGLLGRVAVGRYVGLLVAASYDLRRVDLQVADEVVAMPAVAGTAALTVGLGGGLRD